MPVTFMISLEAAQRWRFTVERWMLTVGRGRWRQGVSGNGTFCDTNTSNYWTFIMFRKLCEFGTDRNVCLTSVGRMHSDFFLIKVLYIMRSSAIENDFHSEVKMAGKNVMWQIIPVNIISNTWDFCKELFKQAQLWGHCYPRAKDFLIIC